MVQLSVGFNGHVWALGADGTVYWREGVDENNKRGTSWTKVQKDAETTAFENVANEVAMCTNGHVWIRGVDNKLYYRDRIITNQQG